MNNLSDIDPCQNYDFFQANINPVDNYYTVENLNNYFSEEIHRLKILSFNIRSFHANHDGFEALLCSLKIKFNILICSETWNNDQNVDYCIIDDFNTFSEYRKQSKGGGVSIFVDINLKSEKIQDLSMCTDGIEICSVIVDLHHCKALIVAIYRSPNHPIHEFNEFFDTFQSRVSSFWTGLTIFSGDLNIDLQCTNNQPTSNFISIMNSYHFKSLINLPTRFNYQDGLNTGSILDHIWINKNVPYNSGVIDFDLTDHSPIFLISNLETKEFLTDKLTEIKTRPFSDQNLNSLKHKIVSTDWSIIYNNLDCNKSCTNFIELINKLYIQSFPLKTKFISAKRLSKPWLSNYLKKQINLKSHYYALFRQNLITKQTNNNLKNKVNRMINNAKNLYYRSALDSNRTNSKKTWNVINYLSGRTKRKFEIPKLVDDDDNPIDSPDEIANKFIHYFGNIANRLEAELPTNNLSPTNVIQRNPNSFFLFPITQLEIIKTIKSLKNTKASLDEIPPKIIKSIANEIAMPLSQILNACMEQGVFPDYFKIARIIPIHKKGPKEVTSNYRPISLLQFFSKVYEKCLAKRLTSFF